MKKPASINKRYKSLKETNPDLYKRVLEKKRKEKTVIHKKGIKDLPIELIKPIAGYAKDKSSPEQRKRLVEKRNDSLEQSKKLLRQIMMDITIDSPRITDLWFKQNKIQTSDRIFKFNEETQQSIEDKLYYAIHRVV